MRRSLYSAAVLAALVCSTRIALAQGAPNAEAAAETRKQFMADLDSLESRFLQLADAFPAEKYSWRPAAGVRSVGEAFMHVASEFYVYTPMAYGGQRSSVIQQGREGFTKFEAMSSKDDVKKHLTEGFAYAKQQLMGMDAAQLAGTKKLFGRDMTIIETSFIMSGDLHEHLGQLIAYARMNGVTPPWSK